MKSEVIIIDSKAYNQLRNDLVGSLRSEVEALAEKLLKKNSTDDWLTPIAARELLGIGKTKFQQLKNNGVLKISQHGRKIKVSRKSILSFLEKNSKI